MKTIVAHRVFKYGDKTFSIGEIFDMDELKCTKNELCRMIKMGYVVWGECTATASTEKTSVKEVIEEDPAPKKRRTYTPRTKKTDESES